jgi:two-component system CheB/CheR fusion protein
MLANLLSNAIRYTATGSVRLSCRRSGERLAITVRDTGAGIPARELGKIFEEFYQVDRGSQRPEGLGLGLSIVRRLAALLGHEVDVESTLGQGTAFTITVPRVALAASAARPTTKAASGGARGKVLVVDDEAAVAHATSLLLELEGFEVRIASCMSEALEMSRVARPDLIVSDYRLRGGETGAEVVNEIRRDAGAPIPAIFVTGDTGKVAAESATLAHTTLLGKPTRVEDLLAAIREHLGATIA